jgi:hypothetical protein
MKDLVCARIVRGFQFAALEQAGAFVPEVGLRDQLLLTAPIEGKLQDLVVCTARP